MQCMTIRFVEEADALSVIELETPVHAQGLEVLWRTFFALRVQIISAQVRVLDSGRLSQRLRVCEFDGAPLEAKRRREVHRALLESFELPAVLGLPESTVTDARAALA